MTSYYGVGKIAEIRKLVMKLKNWLVGLLAIAFCVGPLSGCGLVSNQQLKIMTFNAEFLWDGVEPEEGNADFPWKGNQKRAEARMKQIAQVIQKHNPDLVNLVEVENIAALTTLNDKYLSGKGYQPYLIKGKDTATGQDVALLSKIKPSQIARSDIKGISNGTVKAVSKNYFALFDYQDYKLAIIGVHFLAQPRSKNRKSSRQAQAYAIRALASNLRDRGYLPIILGDFNDYDGEIKDRNNNQPITNVLARLKNLGTSDPQDDLINVLEFIPQSDRYTAYYDPNRDGEIQPDKEYSAIDFILLANELKAKVRQVKIDQSYDPREVSDHFPVIVTLDLD